MPDPGRGWRARTITVARVVLRFGIDLLRRHGALLALVGALIVVPMWTFAELSDEIRENEAIAFDEPLLRLAHARSSPSLDEAMLVVSNLGYAHGVIPVDIALVIALAAFRRIRKAVFAAVALGGSALLNMTTKWLYARQRPSLWDSIAPETTYSFPSGHAMGSATLACVVVALAWYTRARWAAVATMVPFAFAVGLSRVYLGVHYPSDIVAGWCAATLWVVAVYLLVFRRMPGWGGRADA